MPALTPGEQKRLYRWAKGFLIVAIIASAMGLLQNFHHYFDPGSDRHWGQIVHVRIGGRDFAVPGEYIRGPKPTGEAKQLYLWMTLPDYAPYQTFDIENGKGGVPEAERLVMVLIYDTAFTTDLAYRYRVSRQMYSRIPKDVGQEYGLNKTEVYLQRPQDRQPALLNELYWNTDTDGAVNTFINCMRDTVGRYPQCDHHDFQVGRLLYEVDYGKWNLPQWQEIQKQVAAKVDSFSCVPRTDTPKPLNDGAKLCPP